MAKSRLNPELKPKVLKLTSLFEGGWDGVAGDFDGQVLSYGPLQWNFGQGTLQPLLYRAVQLNEGKAVGLLGPELVRAINEGQARAFCQQYMLGKNGRVSTVWEAKLKKFAHTQECSQAFLEGAQKYFNLAEAACNALGFVTERAFALCFDIAVQNGGVRLQHRQMYWPQVSPNDPEWLRLKVLAKVVVACAHPRWQEDVESRKMAIALGSTGASGRPVHGHRFSLEESYGISYNRRWKK